MSEEKMESTLFLEVTKSGSGDEIVVAGNVEGLKHLADAILTVASKNVDGAHAHFDEHTLDYCDMPIVIRLKKVPWDEN